MKQTIADRVFPETTARGRSDGQKGEEGKKDKGESQEDRPRRPRQPRRQKPRKRPSSGKPASLGRSRPGRSRHPNDAGLGIVSVEATADLMPPAPFSLRVHSRIEAPTPAFTAFLQKAVPQGINPAILILDVVLVQKPGTVHSGRDRDRCRLRGQELQGQAHPGHGALRRREQDSRRSDRPLTWFDARGRTPLREAVMGLLLSLSALPPDEQRRARSPDHRRHRELGTRPLARALPACVPGAAGRARPRRSDRSGRASAMRPCGSRSRACSESFRSSR